ncbi:TRAP transporter small permease subunit [Virgifigura deserti]|uniref:TRAP transporter small permease subunit n=1 Tax=Virgifigura deserti TaxID=2268457 RepID=UPI003CCB7BE6
MNNMNEASARDHSRPGGDAAEERHEGGLARLANALETLIDWLGRVAAWLGFALVLLVAFNVILRYLFSVGPVSFQEAEWHLVSPIVMIGIAYAMRHGEHVRVDLFYERFPPRMRHFIDLVVALTTAAIAIIIIYMAVPWVMQSYNIGEGSPDPGGLPYRFALKAFVPFGFLLLLIQAAAQAIKAAIPLFSRSERSHG